MTDFGSAQRQSQFGFEFDYHFARLFGAGQAKANPIIQQTSNEAEKMHLEIDTGAIKSYLSGVFSRHPKIWCPVAWLACTPCAAMSALQAVDSAAAAHKLTLRETTLHYKVEKYNSLGSVPTNFTRTGDDLMFCGANHCQSPPGRGEIEEVLPLELVSEVVVEPNFGQTCCGVPLDGMPSLVVKLNGSPKASASIDSPLNGTAFATAVMEAAQAAKSSGGLDARYPGQDLLSKYTAYCNQGAPGTASMVRA